MGHVNTQCDSWQYRRSYYIRFTLSCRWYWKWCSGYDWSAQSPYNYASPV